MKIYSEDEFNPEVIFESDTKETCNYIILYNKQVIESIENFTIEKLNDSLNQIFLYDSVLLCEKLSKKKNDSYNYVVIKDLKTYKIIEQGKYIVCREINYKTQTKGKYITRYINIVESFIKSKGILQIEYVQNNSLVIGFIKQNQKIYDTIEEAKEDCDILNELQDKYNEMFKKLEKSHKETINKIIYKD